MVLGKLDWYVKKNETKPPTYTDIYTRINSKWIKDLNISCETIKILEESIGNKISNISRSNIIANIFSRVLKIKEKINKWDYNKLKKTSAQLKEPSTR